MASSRCHARKCVAGWRRGRTDGRRRLVDLDRIGSTLARYIWMLAR